MNKRQYKKRLKNMKDSELNEAVAYLENGIKKFLAEQEFDKRHSELINKWNSLDNVSFPPNLIKYRGDVI